MKRFLVLLVTLIMCCFLTACRSKNAVEAQKAINRLCEVNDYYDDFYDTLYLTENGEIHHNEWSSAYETAINAYDKLSESEKSKIYNAGCLNSKDYYIEAYKEILIEQEIALYCKDVAVEKLKNSLINKSSYEEYKWTPDYVHYDSESNTFSAKIVIEYSATNQYGGRVDDIDGYRCEGTYKNGNITIDNID